MTDEQPIFTCFSSIFFCLFENANESDTPIPVPIAMPIGKLSMTIPYTMPNPHPMTNPIGLNDFFSYPLFIKRNRVTNIFKSNYLKVGQIVNYVF